LIESSPDFVGLTDIANLFGFSRQNMRKLVHSNIASFPQPVHAGKSSIWHLHNVLDWFEKDQKRHICPSTKEISHAAMQVNIAKESSNSVKESQAELSRLAL
jgi:predicted DNA-binding transcriptional regulator AlpA